MENEFIKTIVSQGAWAVLFVWLLINTRKESKDREERLNSTISKNQEIISELAVNFNVVSDIKKDIKDIKSTLNIKE